MIETIFELLQISTNEKKLYFCNVFLKNLINHIIYYICITYEQNS